MNASCSLSRIFLLILLCAGSSCKTEQPKQHQTNNQIPAGLQNEPARSLPVASFKMTNLAKLKAEARGALKDAPDELRQSLPVPVKRDGTILVQYFFYPAVARPGKPSEISPPHVRVLVDPQGKNPALVESVDPKDYSQNHKPMQIIGEYGMPSDWTFSTYQKREAELYQLLEQVIPMFAAGETEGEGNKELRKRYFSLFQEMHEQPLGPYYRGSSPEFFGWLGATEKD